MFEVGKSYRLKMWETSSEGDGIAEYHAGEAVEVSLPLVKFLLRGKIEIVNAASHCFVSATPVEPLTAEEEAVSKKYFG